MPIRLGGGTEQPGGPRPFSSDWLSEPAAGDQPFAYVPRRLSPRLPSWVPTERRLATIFVVLLTLVVAFGSATPSENGPRFTATDDAALALTTDMTATMAVPTATDTPIVRPTAPPTEPAPTEVADVDIAPPTRVLSTTTDPRAVLPNARIISYYGHPADANMGIVGEMSKEDLLKALNEQIDAYKAADPSVPVIGAIELISSVAQDWPADNDTYLLHTDAATIQEYLDFCIANDLLLILDIQIGHSNLKDEMDKIEPWFKYPNVHVAIDPEFSMEEGVIPGDAIGGVDAAEITYAQNRLADYSKANNIGPKILIVHQFYEGMIRNDSELAPVDGVQLLIEFDGFGEPANKIAGYTQFIADRPIEYGGIKLFYGQDSPVLTPAEVIALEPSPHLVIYQ